MLVPPEAHGVRCISMGFFAEEDQPVIWRGPMLHKALEQFLTDVFWDDPDYLARRPAARHRRHLASRWPSSCPGPRSTSSPRPQPAAQRVAQRAAFMAEKVNLEVKGVIENMSWFTGDDGKRYEIFGAGGGAGAGRPASRCRCSARSRWCRTLREGGDDGPPDHGRSSPTARPARPSPPSPSAIDVELAPTRRYHPELKIG